MSCERITGTNNSLVGIDILRNSQVVNQRQGTLLQTTVTGATPSSDFRINGGAITAYTTLAVAPFTVTDLNVFSAIMRN